LLVRPCSADACAITTPKERCDGIELEWVPPYYENADRVVCTMGAGNSFLGGLAIGWAEKKDWRPACCYGAVAASFVLEQLGLPIRTEVDGVEL
jgi:sugar/nucleoside kinase (ribokinase family)